MIIGFEVEHPGIILWEEYLEPLKINKSQFARDILDKLSTRTRNFTWQTCHYT